jgi:hypothetical protein
MTQNKQAIIKFLATHKENLGEFITKTTALLQNDTNNPSLLLALIAEFKEFNEREKILVPERVDIGNNATEKVQNLHKTLQGILEIINSELERHIEEMQQDFYL